MSLLKYCVTSISLIIKQETLAVILPWEKKVSISVIGGNFITVEISNHGNSIKVV